MKNRQKTARPAPALRRYLRRVEFDYQVRAFGEEMARVNFLPLRRRTAYLAEMLDFAEGKGVVLEKPALGVTR